MHIHRSCKMDAIRNAKGRRRLEIQPCVSNTTFGEFAVKGPSGFFILHCLSQYSLWYQTSPVECIGTLPTAPRCDVKPIEKQKVKIALSKTDVLLSVITSVCVSLR